MWLGARYKWTGTLECKLYQVSLLVYLAVSAPVWARVASRSVAETSYWTLHAEPTGLLSPHILLSPVLFTLSAVCFSLHPTYHMRIFFVYTRLPDFRVAVPAFNKYTMFSFVLRFYESYSTAPNLFREMRHTCIVKIAVQQ